MQLQHCLQPWSVAVLLLTNKSSVRTNERWMAFGDEHKLFFFSQVAPFHNLFGIAGLSLLDREEQTKAVHPVFCIPEDVVQE